MKTIAFLSLSFILLSRVFAVPVVEIEAGKGFNLMGINHSPYKIKIDYKGEGNFIFCNDSFGTKVVDPATPNGSFYSIYGTRHCGKRVIEVTNITDPNNPLQLCKKALAENDYNYDRNLLEFDISISGSCGNIRSSHRKITSYFLVNNSSVHTGYFSICYSNNNMCECFLDPVRKREVKPLEVIANPADYGYLWNKTTRFASDTSRCVPVLCTPPTDNNDNQCRLAVYSFDPSVGGVDAEYKSYSREDIYLNRIPAYAKKFLEGKK